MFLLDVEHAFDGVERSRMWKNMIKEVGNYSFFHLYKKILDNLHLDVDLGFTKVKDIRSASGSPQGLKLSCFYYTIMKARVIMNVLLNLRDNRLSAVIYSDDITLICSDWKLVKKALELLDSELKVFNLKLAKAKTQFIRFGETDGLKKEWKRLGQEPIRHSEHVKVLGY